MTDTAAGEMPLELEAAPSTGIASAALDFQNLVLGEVKTAEAPSALAAERALPELEHEIGPLRQKIIDHFIDSEGDQTIAQIIAGLGGTVSRNTIESSVRRLYERGRLLRISPGVYRLGPETPEPAEPPEPAASPEPPPERGDQQRADALETDRQRKRLARERDREAAAAKQAEADRALRDALLAACRHGPSRDHSTPALVADDLAPIRAVLRLGVPLKRIERAIAWRTDNDRLTTWRDEKLLRKAGEYFWRFDVLPTLMSVGKAPGKPADAPEASPAVSAPSDQKNASEVSRPVGAASSGRMPPRPARG